MTMNAWRRLTMLLLPVWLLAGCLGKAIPSVTLEWTFDDGPQGWTGGFCDLPVDYDEEMYELEFGHAPRPPEIGDGYALMISGHNRSDDLFMFVKKRLTAADGISPRTSYRVRFEVDLATDAPAGAVGIGGPPGEAVFVKVGAATTEPAAIEEPGATPYFRLSVDKGSQNDDGAHAVRVGNAAKERDEEFGVYEIKTLNNESQPLTARSDKDGNLWIFVGTDSGFEGKTTLYYCRIRVALEPGR